MSYLIFSPTCNILVYPTFYELDVRILSHPVNILVVYLSPKQMVVYTRLGYFLYFSTMVITRSSVSLSTNMASKENVQEQDDGSVNKSPYALKKISDKAPSDTNTTQPLSTPELARQAADLQVHLSVFPNGH
jgi:hypothetical protein